MGQDEDLAELLSRVHVWEADLCASSLDDGVPAWVRRMRPASFWHCAASIKFRETSDNSVWTTNVEGLMRALQLASGSGAEQFNHVSTAYVAGDRGGTILEEMADADFDNVYEESKSRGERFVRDFCLERGLGYRILRPSIVVCHSQTCRTSSDSGVYRVAELCWRMKEMVAARSPDYFLRNPLRLSIRREATINTIPIDVLIAEMMHLGDCPDALNQVFHLTSERPHNSRQTVKTLLGTVGFEHVEIAESDADLSTIDKLFRKGLRAYQPYLNGLQQFDRSNVIRCGASRFQAESSYDMQCLRTSVAEHLRAMAERDCAAPIPA